MISAGSVKELREVTGCGMMDCKKALTETNGDMEKAIEFLREKGLATAAKKAGRIASEGIVDIYTNSSVGVMVEVNSETDFVAKNESFTGFVRDIAQHVSASNPADVDELLTQSMSGSSETVKDMLTEKIAKIGENMNIRRFVRYEGSTVGYIHGGGRIGVLVKFETNLAVTGDDFQAFGKDVAMQIAAMKAEYVGIESVSADVIAKEREILKAQAINEGKPDNIAEKMVDGRIAKYYKEVCLVEQPFVKDGDIAVKDYVKQTADKLGGDIKILEFTRFEKGEGLAKKEDNFADEVASMTK